MHNSQFGNKIYIILGLLAVVMLTACSSDDLLTGGTTDDLMLLTVDVAEADWHGETVSIDTRAGETMESLRASYARSWDFTTLENKEALLALSGLSFSPADGDENNLLVEDVEDAKAVKLNGALTITGLRTTQTVTIVYKTSDAVAWTLVPVPRNFVTISGFGFSNTTGKETGVARVAADGDGIINTTGPVYIYSVDISEAENEGFGLYCSELNYTNTQVTWDHTNSRWNIGEHNYNTYWQRNQTGTLEIYAYAPYNKTGYAVENHMLTFVAEKHNVNMGPGHDYTNLLSGGNVDLLQAYASHERINSNPAKLNFQHSLAKLTFGTVTNHTGETIQLEGFTVKGRMYSQAKLNLATGKWSGHDVWSDGVAETEAEVKLPPDFVQVVHNPAEMAGAPPAGYIAKALILPLHDGQTIIPTMQSNSLLLIPGANGEIVVTIEINNSTGETFSFPITLEQGREKIVNITIGRNFEVVIE